MEKDSKQALSKAAGTQVMGLGAGTGTDVSSPSRMVGMAWHEASSE